MTRKFLFNCPGVSEVARGVNPAYMDLEVPRLEIAHVVHACDTIPRIPSFGEHHPQTRWYQFSEPASTPHSVSNMLTCLDTRNGALPPRMSPSEIDEYLAPPRADMSPDESFQTFSAASLRDSRT